MKSKQIIFTITSLFLITCQSKSEDSKLSPSTNEVSVTVNEDNSEIETLLSLNEEYFEKLKSDTLDSSQDNIRLVLYHYFFQGRNLEEKTELDELLHKYYDDKREFILTKKDSIDLSNHKVVMEISAQTEYLFFYEDSLFLTIQRPFTGLTNRHDTIIKGKIELYNSKNSVVLFNWPDHSSKWR